MRTLIVFAAIVAVALAAVPNRHLYYRPAPPVSNRDVVVVRETPSNNIGLDSYQFGYELSDGQTREESAQVETRSAEESILRVSGSYSWVNPEDGRTFTITYVADENGFQPQGDHIPVAPRV